MIFFQDSGDERTDKELSLCAFCAGHSGEVWKGTQRTLVIGWWRGSVRRQSHCRFPKDDVVQAGLDSL